MNRSAPASVVAVIAMAVAGSEPSVPEVEVAVKSQSARMTYGVCQFTQSPVVTTDWDAPQWSDCEILKLSNFMGEKPNHFPRVEAKIGYQADAVYVIFRVQDRFVRAVADHHQGPVYKDSCVEFFFCPCDNVDRGYFNLEMNCGGTMLFHYQRQPRRDSRPLPEEQLAEVTVAHTLPARVEPERQEPITWLVAYRIPLKMLAAYFPLPIEPPAPGVRWRANLYKCADDTSHPHWLTWAPVNSRRPDFHRPADFGVLEFR